MYDRLSSIYQSMSHKLIWVLMAICILCYAGTGLFYVLHNYQPSGDEPHFLIISQTLLKYHSLNVVADYVHGDYHSFYTLHIDQHVTHNARGQILPVHSIGGPILWLLPFFLFGRLGAVEFIAAVSILTILNIYLLLISMHISKNTAFLVTLIYIVASPLYMYSYRTFIEPIGALVGIYVLRKCIENDIRTRSLLIASCLLAVLPWVHIRFVFLLIPLFFALLYRIYQRYGARLHFFYIVYLLPLVLSFIVLELYSFIIWGSFNPAANQIYDGSQIFEVSPLPGLIGILFDQDHGLLICFPLAMFLIAGIILAMQKRLRFYNLCMLCVSLPYIIAFTSFRHWYGGWTPPARFVLVLLPIWSFYIAYVLDRVLIFFLVRLLLLFSLLWGTFYCYLSILPPHNGFNDEVGKNATIAILNKWLNIQITSVLPSVLHPNLVLFTFWIGLYAVLTIYLVYKANQTISSFSVPATSVTLSPGLNTDLDSINIGGDD